MVEALLYRELGTVAGPENAACMVEECMDQAGSCYEEKKRNVLPFEPTVRVSLRLCASRRRATGCRIHSSLFGRSGEDWQKWRREGREAENSRVSNSR